MASARPIEKGVRNETSGACSSDPRLVGGRPRRATGAPRHSRAIYNATDKPVQWMNINVTAFHGQYDAFDLGDGRVGAPIDPVPQFMAMQLDAARMQQVATLQGGKGTVQYRRALGPTVFQS